MVVIGKNLSFCSRDEVIMSDIAKEIVEGLEDLARRLKAGEPLKVTEVRRVRKPDGDKFYRRKRTIHPKDLGKAD